MRLPQDDYTEVMEEHFQHPRNAGTFESPDAVGRARSGECGDLMTLQLRVVDGVITGARFKTYGCAAAIAASSMLTVLLEGRTLADAAALGDEDVARALGGVPARKLHCSVLAGACLADALADYRRRQG